MIKPKLFIKICGKWSYKVEDVHVREQLRSDICFECNIKVRIHRG